MSKWLQFELNEPLSRGKKTQVWEVVNTTGETLGSVKWRGGWRQYVFLPRPETVFDDGCLESIATFLTDETIKHREKAKNPLRKFHLAS